MCKNQVIPAKIKIWRLYTPMGKKLQQAKLGYLIVIEATQ